jgi:hypothetical protein
LRFSCFQEKGINGGFIEDVVVDFHRSKIRLL